MLRFAYVRQQIPKGLGDAILTARGLVEDEPFAVLLSDDIIVNEVPCLKQMMEVYERFGHSVIAIQRVPRKSVSSYGIIRAHLVPDRRESRPALPDRGYDRKALALGGAL